MIDRTSVLFTTPVLEHPAAGGPALRIENSIKALHRVSELHVVCRVPQVSLGGPAAESFYRGLAHSFCYAPSVASLSPNKFRRQFQRIARRLRPPDDAEFLVEYMRSMGIDVLWAGYGNISHGLIRRIKQIAPRTKIVCDTDSVWSRFVLRELPYVTHPGRRRKIEREGRRKEQEEREWVNLCEVTTAVSDIDARYYRSIASEPERVMLFSNAVDLDSYTPAPQPDDRLKSPSMFLGGSFWPGSPMEQAARWVVSDVLPLVLRDVPDMHLYIVGSGSDRTLTNIHDSRISITGKVGSVLPYLCSAKVALVPLFFESGTRFKIMEAGACCIPVVSTTLGAEGLPARNGVEVLIADEPEGFARAVVRLVQDQRFARQLASNCRSMVEEHCSIARLALEAMAIIDSLQRQSRGPGTPPVSVQAN